MVETRLRPHDADEFSPGEGAQRMAAAPGSDTSEPKLPPVIPAGAVRATGEQRSEAGPREAYDSLGKAPDSLALRSRMASPCGLGFRDDGWKDALNGMTWVRTWVGTWVRTWAHRAPIGAALLLAGAAAGLAAGQAMAQRAAHRAGACSALNMAAALGYLDAEQQRQIRHALATALNPDVDLFLGGPSLHEACAAGADG